jgi:hypothetical protein
MMAAGEEVLLAAVAHYARNEFAQGMCIVVLTPSRLLFGSVFDSRGNPIQEHTKAIPIYEIESAAFRKGTLLERINWGRMAPAIVVGCCDGETIRFKLENAARWHAVLESARSPD